MALINKRRLTGLISASAVIATMAVAAAPAATLAAAPPAPYANGFEDAAEPSASTTGPLNLCSVLVGLATGTDRDHLGQAAATTPSRPPIRVHSPGMAATAPPSRPMATRPRPTSTSTRQPRRPALTCASTGRRRSAARTAPTGRDFIFNVGTDGNGGFVMSASNNARRMAREPGSRSVHDHRERLVHVQAQVSATTTVCSSVDMTVSKLGSPGAVAHVDAERRVGHHRHGTVGGNRYG